jgi:IS5 family transposase
MSYLRKDDRVIFAGAGYTDVELGIWACVGAVNDKRKPGKNLSSSQKKRNRKQSSIRARVEHVFRVIKQQFGFQKTRYRGLEKNASQINLLEGGWQIFACSGS